MSDSDETLWPDDLFNRAEDAEYIGRWVKGRLKSRKERGEISTAVLNIDAGWGFGKSFFMSGFAKHLRRQGHLVAEINAWATDHADDPFVAVLAAIESETAALMTSPSGEKKIADGRHKSLLNNAGRVLWAVGKGGLNAALNRYVGSSLEDLSAVANNQETANDVGDALLAAAKGGASAAIDQSEKLLDGLSEKIVSEFEMAERAIADFKKNLAEIVAMAAEEDHPLPLYILVDELDRCRPPYAIAMLERVKHLFEIEGVVFILATNTEQLTHSIGAVYGTNFQGQAYLRRFFDRTYKFETPEITRVIDHWQNQRPDLSFWSNGSNSLSALVSGFFESHGLDLRTVLQCLSTFEDILSTWDGELLPDPILLMPLVTGLHLGHEPTWKQGEFRSWVSNPKQAGLDKVMLPNTDLSVVSVFERFADVAFREPRGEEQEPRPRDSAVFNDFLNTTQQAIGNDTAYWIERSLLQGRSQYFPNAIPPQLDYPQVVKRAGRLTSAFNQAK